MNDLRTKVLICLTFMLVISFAFANGSLAEPQLRPLGGPAGSPTLQAQDADEITEANWRQHPKIKAIQKIVSSVNAGLKKGTFKTAQRKLQCEEVPYFTLKRIARDSKGAVAWYENYSEGEDSSWDHQQYYDEAGRLRFALILVYAANGSREQHRVYFDETGKLIRQSRKTVKGPGYFAPNNLEELPKEDPAKEFENAPNEGCTEIKSKARRTAKRS